MDIFKCTSRALIDFYDEDRQVMAVVEDIERELGAENKVVCQFLIDGKPLTVEGEDAQHSQRLSQIQSIEYVVADLLTLVREVGESWIEAIDEQTQPLYALAEEMVKKPSRKSYQNLEQAFGWCQEFVDSLGSMKLHRNSKVAHRLLEWDQLEDRLSVTVRDLLTKSEKKDFKGVAYTLEYDLVDTLLCWRKELETFIGEIRAAQNEQQKLNGTKPTSVRTVGRSRPLN